MTSNTALPAEGPGADDWKRAGDACLEREDFPGAIEAYFQALQLDPEHPGCRYNLALVHLELNQYPEAIMLLRGALVTRADDAEAMTTLGWALLWHGEPDEAVKIFRRALLLQSRLPAAHVGLGWAHLAETPPALGRAADAFARAIALDTDDPEAYHGLATVCEMRDEPAQAVPLLETVLLKWPDDARSHEALARILEARGEWEQAAHHLMQLAHGDRDNPILAQRLATLFSANGAHDRAAVFWKRLHAILPSDPGVAAALGETLLAAERPEEAIDALSEAVKLNGDSTRFSALGHAYFDARRYADAVGAYRQAIGLDPTTAAHYFNLGNAYLELPEPENALWAFQQALRHDPGLYPARLGLGWACFGQGRLESAREVFEGALALKPDEPGALDGLGSTLWREGLPELALDALERASRRDPDQGGLRFKLGMIYEELGRFDEARRALQSLISGSFADERAAEALARIEDRLR